MIINKGKPTEVVENNELITVDNSYWVEMNESLKRLMQNEDFNSIGQFPRGLKRSLDGLAIEAIYTPNVVGMFNDAMTSLTGFLGVTGNKIGKMDKLLNSRRKLLLFEIHASK